MVGIRAELTMLLRIANREDTDQTQKQSGLAWSRPFCKATSLQNFKTFTIFFKNSFKYQNQITWT